jgi:hypothetical protein
MATSTIYPPAHRQDSAVLTHIAWVSILVSALIGWLVLGAFSCRNAVWGGPFLLFLAFLAAWVASLLQPREERQETGFYIRLTWKEILALLVFVLAMFALSRGYDPLTLLGIIISPLKCEETKKSALELLALPSMWG